MKTKRISAKACGIIAALIIFVLAHLILGKDDDGNLVVFGVPAIVGGLVVFYSVRLISRKN